MKIDLVGANTQTAVDMTKSDATHYTYIHTVGAGNGMTTVGLSIGTDTAGNVVTAAPTSGATFTVDNIAPTISETTPVPANINIATPSYTFTSDQAGTITYGGDCTSATTSASAGSNTINFAALGE